MLKPSSILLIEQNPIAGKFIQKQALRLGYQVFDQCDDIRGAILAINREGPIPELVIVDLEGPISRQELQQIQILEFLYRLPLLFICCASVLEMNQVRSQSSNSLFLLKPYTDLQLNRALQQLKSAAADPLRKYRQVMSRF